MNVSYEGVCVESERKKQQHNIGLPTNNFSASMKELY